MSLSLALNLSTAARGAGGGEPLPIIIEPPVTLMSFASRASLHSPIARLTDVANDNGFTMQWQGAAGTTDTITSLWSDTPVDLRDGTLSQAILSLENGRRIDLWDIRLFSGGTAAAPGNNYLGIDNPFGTLQAVFKQIVTSEDGRGRPNALPVPVQQLATYGTGADLSAIRGIVIRLRSQAAQPAPRLLMGPLQFQKNPLQNGVVVFRFDDAHASAIDNALPLLSAAGMVGTVAPGAVNALVGQPGRLSWADMRTLKEAGWQIRFQADMTEDAVIVDAMTDAQRTAIITNQDAAYQANGLGVNDRDLTYFSQVGFRDLVAWPMFRDNGVTSSNFFLPQGAAPFQLLGDTYPFADPHMIRGLNAESGTFTNNDNKAFVLAQTVTNRGFIELAFHNDLASLPAWISSVQAAGLTVTTYERLRRKYRHA